MNIGTMSLSGVALTAGVGNMAFSPTGTLYVASGGTVYTVNTTTAALTPYAPLGLGNVNIAFGAGGLLYCTNSNGHVYSVSSTVAAVIPSSAVPVFNSLTATPEFVDLGVAVTATPTVFHTGHTAAYAVNVSNVGQSTTTSPPPPLPSPSERG